MKCRNSILAVLVVLLPNWTIAENPSPSSGVVVARMGARDYRRPDTEARMHQNPDSSLKEARQLVSWVLNARIETVAEEMGITATDEEQRQLLASAQGDLGASAQRIRDIQKALPLALREALRRPDKEEEIYHRHLDGLMSRELWKGNLGSYNSEKKISKLEKIPAATTNDLVRPNSAVRSLVVKQKLREEITRDVAVTDEDVIQVYTHLETTNALHDVRGELESTLIEQKREKAWQAWLRAQLRAAPVTIQNPELKAAYDRYVAQDSVSETP